MAEPIEINRCDNCGQGIFRDYTRKLPKWFHRATGSAYCEPESLNINRSEAEPRD